MKMINENETSGIDNEFKKHRKKHSYVGRQMCVSLYVAMDITLNTLQVEITKISKIQSAIFISWKRDHFLDNNLPNLQ